MRSNLIVCALRLGPRTALFLIVRLCPAQSCISYGPNMSASAVFNGRQQAPSSFNPPFRLVVFGCDGFIAYLLSLSGNRSAKLIALFERKGDWSRGGIEAISCIIVNNCWICCPTRFCHAMHLYLSAIQSDPASRNVSA